MVAASLWLLGGCTYLQLDQGRGPAVFGGLRMWNVMLFEVTKCIPPAWPLVLLFPPILLALPVDLFLDVYLLPFAILNEIRQGGVTVSYP